MTSQTASYGRQLVHERDTDAQRIQLHNPLHDFSAQVTGIG
jgi:hypothetical protein